MAGYQPIDRIDPVGPSPSLLTSARDRTLDDFGTSSPVPDEARAAAGVEGALKPATEAWRTGVAWTPATCQPSSNEARCTSYDADHLRPAPVELGAPVHTEAFTIVTPLTCDWVLSGVPADRIVRDSEDLTRAHTAFGVARALWLGDGLPDTADQPTLRRNATDVSIGGAAGDLDDVAAVLLSQYEQCKGGEGGAVLHVPTPLMVGAEGGIPGGGKIATLAGNYYRGPLGSVVSPGPGYPHGASVAGANGFGPQTSAGPPALYKGNHLDECWVYITGPVEYALGEVRVLPEDEAERRGLYRLNRFEVWGERAAIVRFDPCCVFAALAINNAGQVS